ncbi:MAG: alanine racemase [Acidimicrobiia bacterium]
MNVNDLGTPALLVDAEPFEANLATMAAALPGARCRPHVKAHKCTALAERQRAAGHPGFTCATPRELVGLAEAGLTEDLLLANEVVSPPRLAGLAAVDARVSVAVDSEPTITAAADAGIREVLIDVNVGMPRCGCAPEDAGRLAELARGRGLEVRGVMGYEGHVVGIADRTDRARQTDEAMALLASAYENVGGEIVSAGGTGTFDLNTLATEIQAGSYALMDGAYGELHLPFRRALSVLATVISVSADHAVADCGLKALAMDHGDPKIDGATVWFCSDEHITFSANAGSPPRVGDRVRVWPAHIDPTIAKHERLHVVREEEILEIWAVDLRGW